MADRDAVDKLLDRRQRGAKLWMMVLTELENRGCRFGALDRCNRHLHSLFETRTKRPAPGVCHASRVWGSEPRTEPGDDT